jgi:hypothetical protein
MAKIIIGIHGLNNKPPKRILKKWWKKSIRDGLKKSGYRRPFFRFDLVYWAHISHPKPLNPRIKNKKHPLFLHAPYKPTDKDEPKNTSKLRKKILDVIEKQFDKIFLNEDLSINFSGITDLVIKHFFKDLDIYYSKTAKKQKHHVFLVRDLIRAQLADVLKKHHKKEILLIAHSMGSIITYDVLTQTLPDLPIHTLVTIGSPLGVPVVIHKIAADQKKGKKDIKTPENIKKNWYNLSDLEDRVAFNYNLADDYKPNKNHIRPIDKIVHNDYKINNHRNPHKSYGYLRTPEMAEIIHTFLTEFKGFWLTQLISRIRNTKLYTTLSKNKKKNIHNIKQKTYSWRERWDLNVDW